MQDGGKVVGFPVEIDADGAGVVERIFREYLDGRSLTTIAQRLNADGIPVRDP